MGTCSSGVCRTGSGHRAARAGRLSGAARGPRTGCPAGSTGNPGSGPAGAPAADGQGAGFHAARPWCPACLYIPPLLHDLTPGHWPRMRRCHCRQRTGDAVQIKRLMTTAWLRSSFRPRCSATGGSAPPPPILGSFTIFHAQALGVSQSVSGVRLGTSSFNPLCSLHLLRRGGGKAHCHPPGPHL